MLSEAGQAQLKNGIRKLHKSYEWYLQHVLKRQNVQDRIRTMKMAIDAVQEDANTRASGAAIFLGSSNYTNCDAKVFQLLLDNS